MSYYTILRYKPLDFEIAPKSSEVQATFDEARMYCFSLNVDGKVGWRLPTKYELIKIYNKVSHDFEKDWYTSCTGYSHHSIFMVDFCDGVTGGRAEACMKTETMPRYVRAVRDLKDN
jgi:hypothetical protein